MARSMRGRLLIAIACVAVGLVWVGQGLGLLRGSSFMVDDVRWAFGGAILLLIGAGLGVSVWWARRRP